MHAKRYPVIHEMNRDEIYQVLGRNHVGRLAYARGSFIDIEPLHYVYSDGWLYGRTSLGTKVQATGGGWWPVAFEVDEIDDLFDWRSVVVHGGFYTLSPSGSMWEREEYDRAIRIIRKLLPDAFTAADPTPSRDIIFRIAVQEVTGRKAVSQPTPDAKDRSEGSGRDRLRAG